MIWKFIIFQTVLPPTEELVNLSSNHISYTVTRLSPFTDYNFSVSAFTTVGEGPATLIAQKTQEQGKMRPEITHLLK